MTRATEYHLVMHRPLVVALLWAPLGCVLALATPWTGLWPVGVQWLWNSVPLLLTAVVIAWNLVAAIRLFGATGQPHRAWPFTLIQVILFTLLFFQIACHRGAEHYRWDEHPHWCDWPLFTAVHAVRAADLFDWLEAYGLDLQVINHEGWFTGSCLLAYHLIIDLFVIAILVQGINRAVLVQGNEAQRRRLLTGDSRFDLKDFLSGIRPKDYLLFTGIGFVVVWLITLAVRPWRAVDVVLWPVDNLLRVVDVGDAMELFDIRLTQVPKNLWEGTLTCVCRTLMGLLVGGLLARLVAAVSLRRLGGYGLRLTTLETLLRQTTDPALRQAIRHRLDVLRNTTIVTSASRWGWTGSAAAVAVTVVLAVAIGDWPAWDAAGQDLTGPARQADHPNGERARAALQRMGSYADSVAEKLGRTLRETTPAHRQQLVTVLAHLGASGQAVLGEILQSEPPQVALSCIPPLQQRGPCIAPVLACGLTSPHPEVGEQAEQAVLRLGHPAVLPLIRTMADENVSAHGVLVVKLDPQYWYRHGSPNPVYQKIAEAGPAWVVVKDLPSDSVSDNRQEVKNAIKQLGSLGPSAKFAVPVLVTRLADMDSSVRAAAASALGEIGSPAAAAVPALLDLVGGANVTDSWAAAKALDQIAPTAIAAIPAFLARLSDKDARVRVVAAKALRRLGGAVVPAYLERLVNEDPEVRRATASALEDIGPAAAAAVPALVERLTDERPEVGRAAARALDKIDKHCPSSSAAAATVPALISRLSGKEPNVRYSAAELLGKLAPAAVPAVPALVQRLADGNKNVRLAATEALGKIGPAATAAVPSLEKLLGDSEAAVEKAAREALQRIRGTTK